jgi:hypothetical protein
MAINYYRTVLGIGVSLMTMELIIGLGIQFLQQLVATTGQNPDAAAPSSNDGCSLWISPDFHFAAFSSRIEVSGLWYRRSFRLHSRP